MSFENDKKDIIRAAIEEDINALVQYHKKRHPFNEIFICEHCHDGLSNISTENNLPLLHFSIAFNKKTTFETLLGFGLNIEIKEPTHGTSPLHFATAIGKVEYVKLLINKGADVNSKDNQSHTPLSKAILSFGVFHSPHMDIAALLLDDPRTDVNILIDGMSIGLFEYVCLNTTWFSRTRDYFEHKIAAHPTFDMNYHLSKTENEYTYEKLESYKAPDDQSFRNFNKELTILSDKLKTWGHQFDFSGDYEFSIIPGKNFLAKQISIEGSDNDKIIKQLYLSFDTFYTMLVLKSNLPDWAVETYQEVLHALQFTQNNPLSFKSRLQYQEDETLSQESSHYYNRILSSELTIISSGWSEHSVYFVIDQNRVYYINRGDDSDGIHGIQEFLLPCSEKLDQNVINKLCMAIGSSEFILEELPKILNLELVGQVDNPVQVVGNCAWTSGETAIEAGLISSFLKRGLSSEKAHELAKQTFHLWEEFDKGNTFIQIIENTPMLMKYGLYGEVLIKTLTAHYDVNNPRDVARCAFVFSQTNPDISEAAKKFINKEALLHNIISHPSIVKAIKDTAGDSYTLTEILNDPQSEAIFASDISPLIIQTYKNYEDFLNVCRTLSKQQDTSIPLHEILQIPTSNDLESLFQTKESDTHTTSAHTCPTSPDICPFPSTFALFDPILQDVQNGNIEHSI